MEDQAQLVTSLYVSGQDRRQARPRRVDVTHIPASLAPEQTEVFVGVLTLPRVASAAG